MDKDRFKEESDIELYNEALNDTQYTFEVLSLFANADHGEYGRLFFETEMKVRDCHDRISELHRRWREERPETAPASE